MTEEVAFPRGGRDVARKAKRTASSASIAPLFTTSAPKRQRATPVKASAAARGHGGDSDMIDAEDVLADLTPLMRAQVERRLQMRRAFTLTFPRLKIGMILMGSVREVRDTTRDGGCLLISLPNNLHGRVVRAATGEAARTMLIAQRRSTDDVAAELGDLSESFTVGQYVRCVVVGLDKVGNSRRVELSLRPSLVNNGMTRMTIAAGCVVSAEIKSEEDHGYIVSLGVDELTGFVPKKKAGAAPMRRGQVVEAAVTAVRTDSGVVTLATETRSVTTAVAPGALALRAIKPGLLVRVSIDKLLADGVLVSFLGSHFGTVDWSHFHEPFAAATPSANEVKAMTGGAAGQKKKGKAPWHQQWRKVYDKTLPRPLIARVIHVDYESSSVGLSFAPHILVRRACGFDQKFAMGQVVDNAIVRRVDRGHGVLLELPAASVAGEDEDGSDSESESDSDDADSDPESLAAKAKAARAAAKAKKARGTAAYVHISNVADDTTESLSAKFQVGTTHKCRVMDFQAIDGLVTVSLKPSVVEAQIVQYSEATPGLVVTGVVASVDGKVGAVVTLGDKLKGFVTPMHMMDMPNLTSRGHPLKPMKATGRWAVGAKIQVRVLSCEEGKKKLMLSAKKSLVKCKLPALATYEGLERGQIAHGFITGVVGAGLIVTFLNNVHGLVPIDVLRHHLAVSKGAAAAAVAAHFRVGHLIKCAVKGVTFAEGRRPRLKLTLADAASLATLTRTHDSTPRTPLPPIGSVIVGAVVSGLDESGAGAAAQPTGLAALLVALPDGARGTLAAHHLSDHAAHVAPLHARLARKGVELGELVVLRHEHKKAVLTRKPLLIAVATAAKEATPAVARDAVLFPATIGDVVVGSLICAVVSNVAKFGVFVRCLGRLTALAPRAAVADEFVADPTEHFAPGQSVLARVKEVRHDTQRVVLSLKLSDVLPRPATSDATLGGAANAELLWLRSLVREQQLLGDVEADASGASEGDGEWAQFAVGARVEAVVKVVKEYGTVVHFVAADGGAVAGAKGFAIARHAGDAARGDTVTCRVLGVDAKKRVVDVSLLPALVATAAELAERAAAEAPKKKKRKSAKAKAKAASAAAAPLPKANARVKVAVEFVRASSYAVVSIAKNPGTLALAALSHYNGAREVPALGAKVSCNALAALEGEGDGASADGGSVFAFCLAHKKVQSRTGGDGGASGQIDAAELVVGLRLSGTVHAKHDDHAIIALRGVKMSHVRARIHATAAVDFAAYAKGTLVDVVVTQLKTRDGKKLVELTPYVGGSSGGSSAESSASARTGVPATGEVVPPGTALSGVVGEVREAGAWVLFTPTLRGWLPLLDLGDSALLESVATGVHFSLAEQVATRGSAAAKALRAGQRITCTVVRTDPRQGVLVSARSDEALRRPLRRGVVVVARIARVEEAWLVVQLPASLSSAKGGGSSAQLFGRVCITELCERDAWVDEPLGAFDEGGFVRCVVTKVAKDKKRARGGGAAPPIVDLSMRSSLIAAAEAAGGDAKAFEANAPLQLALDDVVTGYVAATSTKGCFVRVAHDVTARVMLKNLSDAFVDDVAETFPAGKLVAARVIEVKEIKGKGRAVELSMKQSVVAGGDDATPRLRWGHLKIGATLQGRVRRVEAYGVFVTLDGGEISGLCHKSNASDTRIKELSSIYAEGDSVQVKIMGLDQKTKKISLGMKPSLFANDDASNVVSFPGSNAAALEGEAAAEEVDEEEATSSEDEEESSDEEEEAAADGAAAPKASSSARASSASSSALSVDSAFAWGGLFGADGAKVRAAGDVEEEEDSASDDGGSGGAHTSGNHASRKRLAALRKEEEEVRAREEELVDGNALPRSAEDFERLVVTNTNSSYLWVKYMGFQLSCTEVAKARAIAGRALSMINFRLETERMNVWVALLNLESRFGTQESLDDCFQRACKAMPQQPLYEQLLRIYEEEGKLEKASRLLKVMTRKFKGEQSVWLKYISFVLRNADGAADLSAGGKSTSRSAGLASKKLASLLNDGSKAKKALDRALQCLPKKSHVDTVIKFAQMEYKDGSAERGRTTFDEVLAVYPKRLDVWNILLDKEVQEMVKARVEEEEGGGEEGAFERKRGEVRRLFERICHTKFSTKKMESLFKKYSSFEAMHGTPEGRQRVLDLAAEYVEAIEQEALTK